MVDFIVYALGWVYRCLGVCWFLFLVGLFYVDGDFELSLWMCVVY